VRRTKLAMAAAWCAAFGAVCLAAGCSRPFYRVRAERDAYEILNEHERDPRWQLPSRAVEADPRSRMADPSNPDFGPLPPDDAAAAAIMRHPYKFTGWRGWDRRGTLPSVEFPGWREQIGAEGPPSLGRETVMRLGLMNSREYQTQVESLFLDALAVSFERFEFDVHWFAGTALRYDHAGHGGPPDESNRLSLDNSSSLQQNLAGGGQLLADFANSFVWEFTGRDVSMASSGLLFTWMQPLLRGACKQVRLERLTQSERNLLYSIRDFARFRRTFYVDIESDTGYLGLLLRVQAIRNQQFNLRNLERSLREHEELAAAGQLRPIQVDQVFQQYQSARLNLLQTERGYETALDGYKFRLGLPPTLEVRLDESPLAAFELNDPRLDELRDRNEQLNLALLQYDEAPPLDVLEAGFKSVIEQQKELAKILEQVVTELDTMRGRLEAESKRLEQDKAGAAPESVEEAIESALEDLPAPEGATDDGVVAPRYKSAPSAARELDEHTRRRRLVDVLAAALADTRTALDEDHALAERSAAALAPDRRDDAWIALRQQIGRRFRERSTDVLVIQTQIRVYLIELSPVDLGQEEAVRLALDNRLDLMNSRADVVDAYRRVEVAADALQANLNVRASANLLTDPEKNSPLRFDVSANRYVLGLEFDGPLVKVAERNVYRASQIAYQQARRAYMASEDAIVREIRRELRDLELSRFQFDIARQQLVVAARQVDEAQINLQSAQQADSSFTQDLLDALSNLLSAKNNLIGGWVNYETVRMNLFRDLDLMQIDAQGNWTNERNPTSGTDTPPAHAEPELHAPLPPPPVEEVARST